MEVNYHKTHWIENKKQKQKQTNKTQLPYKVICFLIISLQVQVGDILKIMREEFFPADLILLSSR